MKICPICDKQLDMYATNNQVYCGENNNACYKEAKATKDRIAKQQKQMDDINIGRICGRCDKRVHEVGMKKYCNECKKIINTGPRKSVGKKKCKSRGCDEVILSIKNYCEPCRVERVRLNGNTANRKRRGTVEVKPKKVPKVTKKKEFYINPMYLVRGAISMNGVYE